MGVTTRKNINPIINGEIILPRSIPNLNQSLFKGFKTFELINPNIKKTNEIIIDQILIPSLLSNGYKAIIKKTTKKTIPKLLLELILTSFMKIIYIHVNNTWQ